MMTIVFVILTAVIGILQLENLKSKPINFKAWATLLAIMAAAIVSYFIEQGKTKEEKYAKDAGKLLPDKTTNKKLLWELNGISIVFSDGVFDIRKGPSYLHGIKFKAWLEDNRIFVTTDVRDSLGGIIAKMEKNEWILNSNARLDKNFDNNALEVIDNNGDVIFQIDIRKSQIYFQGLFYQPNGNATVITTLDLPNGEKTTMMATFINEGHGRVIPPNPLLRLIQPLFKYPSSLHSGVRK